MTISNKVFFAGVILPCILFIQVYAQPIKQAAALAAANVPTNPAVYENIWPPYRQFPFKVNTDSGAHLTTRAEYALQSGVIDQLRSEGIHVDNNKMRSKLPRPDFAAAEQIFITRELPPMSQAGVNIKVTAWPNEAQALSYLDLRKLQGVSVSSLLQRGPLVVEVGGSTYNQSTQQAALKAMSGFTMRDLELKPVPKDMDRWEFVNRGGDSLIVFMREFPDSPYRVRAEQGLAAYPRSRGAIFANNTDVCKANLKQQLNSLPPDVVIPNDAFLKSDELEMGTRGRSVSDTPLMERELWDLRMGREPNSCNLGPRWGSYGFGLKNCECVPLASGTSNFEANSQTKLIALKDKLHTHFAAKEIVMEPSMSEIGINIEGKPWIKMFTKHGDSPMSTISVLMVAHDSQADAKRAVEEAKTAVIKSGQPNRLYIVQNNNLILVSLPLFDGQTRPVLSVVDAFMKFQ